MSTILDFDWIDPDVKANLLNEEKNVSPVSSDLLSTLISNGTVRVFTDYDTMTSGRIVLFEVSSTGAILGQEQDSAEGDKGFVWRLFRDTSEANDFLTDRKEMYSALWGGACCEETPKFDKKWIARNNAAPVVCANPRAVKRESTKIEKEDSAIPTTTETKEKKGLVKSIMNLFKGSSKV